VKLSLSVGLLSFEDDRSVDSWEDITGTTPLTVSGNVVSFVTSVSARYVCIHYLSIQLFLLRLIENVIMAVLAGKRSFAVKHCITCVFLS